MDREILVLAEAAQHHGTAVEEELVPAHLDGADADFELVGVDLVVSVPQGHVERVEEGILGTPQPCVVDAQARMRDPAQEADLDRDPRVAALEPHLAASFGEPGRDDDRVDHAGRAVDRGGDSHIVDWRWRDGAERDRAIEPAIREKS